MVRYLPLLQRGREKLFEYAMNAALRHRGPAANQRVVCSRSQPSNCCNKDGVDILLFTKLLIYMVYYFYILEWKQASLILYDIQPPSENTY